jgi:hypothetical protein
MGPECLPTRACDAKLCRWSQRKRGDFCWSSRIILSSLYSRLRFHWACDQLSTLGYDERQSIFLIAVLQSLRRFSEYATTPTPRVGNAVDLL